MNSSVTSAHAARSTQKNNSLTEADVITQFCRAMGEQDIHVSAADIIADGKLHRVRADGDRDKTVWFVLHADDRPAGMFGCNRKYGHDQKFTWKADIKRAPLTAAEKRAYRERMERIEAERAAQLAADHAAAAERANRLWNEAVECEEHPYLERKGVRAHGLRVGRWEVIDQDTGEVRTVTNQALLIPMRDLKKRIHSLQAIMPQKREGASDKWYLTDGDKEGHFWVIGRPLEHNGKQVLILCEGWATGASIHEATGHAVIIAFDAPNLLPVAKVWRERFPDAIIVIAADNDQFTLKPIKNPGVTRAREAAAAVGALVAIPPFDASLGATNERGGRAYGPTDMNDLQQLEGTEAICGVIDRVLSQPPEAAREPANDSAALARYETVVLAPDAESLLGAAYALRILRRGIKFQSEDGGSGSRGQDEFVFERYGDDLVAHAERVRCRRPDAQIYILGRAGEEEAALDAAAQCNGIVEILEQQEGGPFAGWFDFFMKALDAKADDDPAAREFAEQAVEQARVGVDGEADAAEPLSPERAIVAELNEHHAVVLAGDKAVVLRECPSDTPGHGIEVRLLAAAAFKLFYCNRTLDIMVMNAEGESHRRTVQIADWWLKSAERRTYEGITFAPGGDAPANYYNLWHGYAVEPRQASRFSNALKCRRLLRHIKLNVCRGNREHFRYLLAWAADMVQDPSRKKGVALVLRGNKGSGKSKVAEVFASLLGHHAIKISQMKHLVGNFNRHLANKLLVVAEESFWAGDKADDGPLKDMITSPTITLEAKGIDAIEMRSFARIMMITNNSWAVPATSDERRYFVLDVGNDKREDHAYFAAIDEQMDRNEQEGRRALLGFLLAFDLSKVNLRKVPETAALREQRSLSLEPHDQFIFDALLDKRIAGRDWDWEIEVPKDELHGAYIDAGKKRSKSHLLPNSELAKKLRRFNIISSKPREGGRRVPSYRFPEWEVCVARFEELMGIDVDAIPITDSPADEPF